MIASHAGQNRTRQLISQSLSSVMTCVNFHSRIPHHLHSKLITTASTSTINPDRYSAHCDLSAVLSGLDLTPIPSQPSQSSILTKFISLSLGSLRSLRFLFYCSMGWQNGAFRAWSIEKTCTWPRSVFMFRDDRL